MRRLVLLVGLSLALAGLLAGPTSAVRPQPYTAVLAQDGSCLFTLTAGWSGGKVGSVVGMWYVDDVYWVTTSANASKSKSVTMRVGPASVAGESHAWKVLTQFYSGADLTGAQLHGMTSNVVTANCVLPGPA